MKREGVARAAIIGSGFGAFMGLPGLLYSGLIVWMAFILFFTLASVVAAATGNKYFERALQAVIAFFAFFFG